MRPHHCSIVPPDLLARMAAHPDPVVRGSATATIQATQRLLGQRDVLQAQAPLAQEAMQSEYRQVFDCQNGTNLPGRLVVSEGGAVPDLETHPDVVEAYLASDLVYRFYLANFGRQGVDGQGMRMISSVRYSRHFSNAYWQGRQMVYGDGDGVVFGRFTAAEDVIAHELTHGVTQFTAGLEYQGESGALNESVSDCFGVMCRQWHLGQTAEEADWLVGAGLFKPGVKGRALRDMLNPGTAYDDPHLGHDPQPAHYKDYVRTWSDSGGVHTNSGIPNRAFALACRAAGGYSWAGVGRAWYRALTTIRNPRCLFREWALLTVDSATRELGIASPIPGHVRHAWEQVGVL